MRLQSLTLKDVRCFKQVSMDFTSQVVLIEGDNGSGKSSIVEALSYCCYVRSFRTSKGSDIARIDGDGSFFIRLNGEHDDEAFTLQVGFDGKTKRVKVNGKVVTGYKALLDCYRAIVLAEHDLALIAEGPDVRRSFFNQYCMLISPTLTETFKSYKKVLSQRNSLLSSGYPLRSIQDQLAVWSKQLYELTQEIEAARCQAMDILSQEVNELLETIGRPDLAISCMYEPKRRERGSEWEAFWHSYLATKVPREMMMKRTLFGAHLDDISIQIGGKPARVFASRGQQKLLLVLLKIAQARYLERKFSGGVVLLFDDFLTDFDQTILSKLLDLITQLTCQIVITCPLHDMLTIEGAQVISVKENGVTE